jgi:hypothetical protein
MPASTECWELEPQLRMLKSKNMPDAPLQK